MEYARKMVVVPQDMLTRMEEHKMAAAATSSNNDLNAEMQRIMNSKGLSDSDKWKQYQQVLRRFLHLAAENRQPIKLPIVDSDASLPSEVTSTSLNESSATDDAMTEEIIDSLPTAYKTETRGLLRIMNKRPDLIWWSSDGSVYVKGEKIQNSNIIDIMHHIVRQRKTTTFPTGWQEVMGILKDMNVPSTYLGNLSAYEFLGRSPLSSTMLMSQHRLSDSNLSSIPIRHLTDTPLASSSRRSTPSRRSSWAPETPSTTPARRKLQVPENLKKGWEDF
jgi:hypothetical protein